MLHTLKLLIQTTNLPSSNSTPSSQNMDKRFVYRCSQIYWWLILDRAQIQEDANQQHHRRTSGPPLRGVKADTQYLHYSKESKGTSGIAKHLKWQFWPFGVRALLRVTQTGTNPQWYFSFIQTAYSRQLIPRRFSKKHSFVLFFGIKGTLWSTITYCSV